MIPEVIIVLLIAFAATAIVVYRWRTGTARMQRLLEQRMREQTIELVRIHSDERKARLEAETAKEDANRANLELERKNKELEQFVYIASHDLREPLRTTSSFVELLQQQYAGKLDERADKYLSFIVQSTERMRALINDLLDYSRIGNKKEVMETDCNTLAGEVINDLGIIISESNTDITIDPLPIIYGYPTSLKQLFQNLLTNGIKFRRIDNTPRIHISAKATSGQWHFSFTDNGIGIDHKHFDRIFIIFQRLHTRNEYEGSGIGLAHCKKIVELHGGRIWVDSVPGKGSTFHFTIPRSDFDIAIAHDGTLEHSAPIAEDLF